ncbi:hypothetical protein [Peribacillus frigoritolerans]|uniref:hypothetical protein n=1 Tax=Peribacillus frigoritolerans TaxID=450367 RepID=UPI0031DBC728
MERKVRDSCGKSVAKEDPAGALPGRTARGKRVPGVEIITHTHFRKSAPFRRLPAKPPRRKRLRGLGYPVIRQESRKFLPSFKDYCKKL